MLDKPFSPYFIAIIAYLTPFGLIAAYFLNHKEKHALPAFHIKNMFGITCLFYTGMLLGKMGLDQVHEMMFIAAVLMWIISFIRMLLKQQAAVPVIDQQFQKWFKFLN